MTEGREVMIQLSALVTGLSALVTGLAEAVA